MDDSLGIAFRVSKLVCMMETITGAGDHPNGYREWELLAVLAAPFEYVTERFAFDELHYEVGYVFFDPHICELHHVWVLQPSSDPRLIDQHLNEARLLRQMRVDLLDGYPALDPDVFDESTEENCRHAALA